MFIVLLCVTTACAMFRSPVKCKSAQRRRFQPGRAHLQRACHLRLTACLIRAKESQRVASRLVTGNNDCVPYRLYEFCTNEASRHLRTSDPALPCTGVLFSNSNWPTGRSAIHVIAVSAQWLSRLRQCLYCADRVCESLAGHQASNHCLYASASRCY